MAESTNVYEASMLSFLEQRTPSNVCNLPYRIEQDLANTYQDINSELDELDREEFYRLKKVSNKKQRDNAAADAEILAARERAAEKAAQNGTPPVAESKEPEPETTDVLGEQEDNDVIF
jgi:hypothetical protein